MCHPCPRTGVTYLPGQNTAVCQGWGTDPGTVGIRTRGAVPSPTLRDTAAKNGAHTAHTPRHNGRVPACAVSVLRRCVLGGRGGFARLLERVDETGIDFVADLAARFDGGPGVIKLAEVIVNQGESVVSDAQ